VVTGETDQGLAEDGRMDMSGEERKEEVRMFDFLVKNHGVPGQARLCLTGEPREWYVQILGKETLIWPKGGNSGRRATYGSAASHLGIEIHGRLVSGFKNDQNFQDRGMIPDNSRYSRIRCNNPRMRGECREQV
jgi:hypothetical protein